MLLLLQLLLRYGSCIYTRTSRQLYSTASGRAAAGHQPCLLQLLLLVMLVQPVGVQRLQVGISAGQGDVLLCMQLPHGL